MPSRHVLLLTVLWTAARAGAGDSQPPADDDRIGRLESRLTDMRRQVDSQDYKLDSLDARLEELVSRFDVISNRLNSRLNEMNILINSGTRPDQNNRLVTSLDDLSSRVDGLTKQLEDQDQACRADPRSQLHRRDCSELPPGSPSGIYLLQPGLDRSGPPVAAVCDQDTDGGGWTVIQRRADIQPRQDFNLTWAAYREGFGSLDKEFWWGLENLWRMTKPRDRQYELRVDLADFDGGRRHAVYQQFRVASEADGYRLSVGEYSGDAGDSMANHNGWKFSTPDRDHDGKPYSCAQKYDGAWWFKACYHVHLNGLYLRAKQDKDAGIVWKHWRGWYYSLKEADMKLRPINRD